VIRWRDALESILENVGTAAAAKMAVGEALGLVAAEDVCSQEALPPFDNSAMDGFAVRSGDCAAASAGSPILLRVLEDLPAGCTAAQSLAAGTAIRIMTGAPLPQGCDAVVPVEDTRCPEDQGGFVEVIKPPRQRAHIRFAGEDINVGQTAISRGRLINAAHIGLLAALGVPYISVLQPVRVAILTTGNELVDAPEIPSPGKIRDANIHSITALVRSWGALPMGFPRIGDSHQAVVSALERAAAECDLLLTTGGVSVGDYDFVKDALNSLGARQHFWRIAQKPGGPFGFWTLSGKPFFGIPGNPVSAIVMAQLYLKPAIQRMKGKQGPDTACVRAKLEGGFRKSGPDGKRHFLRVCAEEHEGGWTARLAGPQGSAQLTSMCAANALAMIPEDAVEIPEGGEVELLMYG
jgi:molybdopterin molybdotransferase